MDGATNPSALRPLVALCATFGYVKVITQRELRNESARVMDDVEAGQCFVLTRRGQTIAQIVPLRGPRSTVPTAELIAGLRGMPHLDLAAARADADDFFGDDGDRVG